MLEIREVKTNRDLKAFVNFPLELYKDNKYFVPPILCDEIRTLRKDKNPCFEFCKAKYFLAYSDGKIVGRIAGILNRRANEIWKHKHIRFGWLDFIDDIEVSTALFKEVENWAKENDLTHIEGPMGFCDLDKEGILVEGFEELSMMHSYYNYPYYPQHMEKLGFAKDVDWIEIKGNNLDFSDDLNRLLTIAKKRLSKYKIIEIKTSKVIDQYKSEIVKLLNLSYESIHGYVPINERIFDHYFKDLFHYTNLDFVSLIENPEGTLVGFGLAMPLLSESVKKANGKLFPTGYFKIKRAFKVNTSVTLILVAVHPDMHLKGIPLLIIDAINSKLIKNGITNVEVSHMLESNVNVQNLWKHFKSKRQHKRRRSYIKQII